MAKKETKSSGKEWSFTGAFALLGLGLGLLTSQPAAGLFIGLGIGLLVTSYLRYKNA